MHRKNHYVAGTTTAKTVTLTSTTHLNCFFFKKFN
jgi:hypothetical protein